MLIAWVCLGAIMSLYCLTIISLAFSWGQIKTYKPVSQGLQTNTFISVIIALRNEECNLPRLINAIKSQNISKECFEVILVNDHSTDGTLSLAKKYALEYSWLKILNLEKHLEGKKKAISKGISVAKGELLAFSDGDCVFSNNWLTTLSAFYEEKDKPDFIIGLVDLQADTLTQNLFRLEFLSLIISGAGAYGLNKPIYCNAANMAVKKTALSDASTTHDIPSGDDVFLLHEMKAKNKRIELLKSPLHLVKTLAPKTLREFYEQRKRWASKTKQYTNNTTVYIALLIFISNIALIASIALMIGTQHYSYGLTIYILKFIADFILFLWGTKYFQYPKLLLLLPLLSIFYPFYVAITAFSSQKSPFVWKGRKYLG